MLKPPLRSLCCDSFFRRTTWCTILAFSASFLFADWSAAQSRKQGSRGTQAAASKSKVAKGSEESKKEVKEDEKAPQKVMIGGVEWYVDYDAALKIAQEENKPMWLHFGENPG